MFSSSGTWKVRTPAGIVSQRTARLAVMEQNAHLFRQPSVALQVWSET